MGLGLSSLCFAYKLKDVFWSFWSLDIESLRRFRDPHNFDSSSHRWTANRSYSYEDSFPMQTTYKIRIQMVKSFKLIACEDSTYFGFHSSFLDFSAFRESRCFSSRRVFSKAAPSMSPVSSFRTSGRSRESVGHSRFGGLKSGISFKDIANRVNW